jgi:hypothetical protein
MAVRGFSNYFEVCFMNSQYYLALKTTTGDKLNCSVSEGYKECTGSSGSIVSDHGLDDRAIGVRSPAGAKDFSSNLCVQTGSGAHPASCTMGTGGPFPGDKSAAGA